MSRGYDRGYIRRGWIEVNSMEWSIGMFIMRAAKSKQMIARANKASELLAVVRSQEPRAVIKRVKMRWNVITPSKARFVIEQEHSE